MPGMGKSKAADRSVRATRSSCSNVERIPYRAAVGLSKSTGVLHCAARFRAALFRMTRCEEGAAMVFVIPGQPWLQSVANQGAYVKKPRAAPALSEVEGSARATRSLSLVVSDEGSRWLLVGRNCGFRASWVCRIGPAWLEKARSGLFSPGGEGLTRWVPLHMDYYSIVLNRGENSLRHRGCV